MSVAIEAIDPDRAIAEAMATDPMHNIKRTQLPEYLLRECDAGWEVAHRIGELIGDFDLGRWGVGVLWNKAAWSPGCTVCALGAAIELLVDPEILPTLKRHKPLVGTVLYEAYVERFGPVESFDYWVGVTLIMRLNDGVGLNFAEIRETMREAYDEYRATRERIRSDREDYAGTSGS